MDELDLTLAICAHNAEKRLPETLAHVVRQGVPSNLSWELIVIDNASKDDTSAVAESFADRIPNLRVIREDRAGLVHARKRAALEARGRIIAFVDDDNWLESDWIAQAVAFLDAHPAVGFIGGKIDAHFEDPVTKPPDFDERFRDGLAIRDFGDRPQRLLAPHVDPPPGAGLTGRTPLVRQILVDIGCQLVGHSGGKLCNGEDTEMGLIAQRLGWETWYVPALKMRHVLPPGRLTDEYLCRLIADGAQSGPWLDYLRGRAPRRSRPGYAIESIKWSAKAAKMRLLSVIRPNHPDAAKYRFLVGFFGSTAAGNRALARWYPFKRMDEQVKRFSVEKPEP